MPLHVSVGNLELGDVVSVVGDEWSWVVGRRDDLVESVGAAVSWASSLEVSLVLDLESIEWASVLALGVEVSSDVELEGLARWSSDPGVAESEVVSDGLRVNSDLDEGCLPSSGGCESRSASSWSRVARGSTITQGAQALSTVLRVSLSSVDASSSAGTSTGVVSVDELDVVEGDNSVAHSEDIVLVARPDGDCSVLGDE